MKTRACLLLAVASVFIAGCGWQAPDISSLFGARADKSPQPHVPLLATFSPEEINPFLASAMASESNGDPLLRCLTYPDPPGSHWAHPVVEAYCRYSTQPYLRQTEVRDLIDSGHVDEVDRRLAQALLLQRTQPDSRGLLDHIYNNGFLDATPKWRATVDAWKRKSPRSAFAWTASGWAYVAEAGEARGEMAVDDTPPANLAAMTKLLERAKTELAAATELDPHVTPAYAAMMIAARMAGDDKYADAAVNRGLEIDPSSYLLHAQLMESAEPEWGGSLQDMKDVAAHAQEQAKNNPLLVLLLPQPGAYDSGICGCGYTNPLAQIASYKVVLDQPATVDILESAGNNAKTKGQREFALVYLSEALRFHPGLDRDRMGLIGELMSVSGRPSLSKVGRQAALLQVDRAMARSPTDTWTLAQLGGYYIQFVQWDKAWNIADQLVRTHPEQINGWVLRAMIQKAQPRPGLRDTDEYIVAHFGDDPQDQENVALARQDLAVDRAGAH